MVNRTQGMIVRMKELLDYGEGRLRGPFVFRTRQQVAVVLEAVSTMARDLEDEIDASMPKRRRRTARHMSRKRAA